MIDCVEENMKIYFSVKNFGKIEHAKIDISNFTIFVGNNNSGKTQLMQLIYGVLLQIVRMPLFGIVNGEFKEQRIFNKEIIKEVEEYINIKLNEDKEEIVKNIFKFDIRIDYMKIEFCDLEYDYKLTAITDKSLNSLLKRELISEKEVNSYLKNSKQRRYIILSKESNGVEEKITCFRSIKSLPDEFLYSYCFNEIIVDLLGFDVQSKNPLLFLPASRTGLLMLYKNFFANQSTGDEDEDEERMNVLGLTLPVYNFLQFLLNYNYNPAHSEEQKKILEFIEQHVIDGKIIEVGDTTFYRENGTEATTPLYVSSSMVNEITPLIKMITNSQKYNYIFYDEIETCLHPLKQVEMARLLNRLNNSGLKMIISTHSDTMASNINNLLLLSRGLYKGDELERKLKQSHLESDDLLKSQDVHVYQFINQDNITQVSELEFSEIPFTGYDFSLFNENAKNIYTETKIAMGID